MHAYTGRYGPAGQENRAKDLMDVVLISDLAELDVARLRSALEATFDRRNQQSVPPGNWSVACANLAQEVGLATDLSLGHREAVTFLDPVLTGTAQVSWNPGSKRWRR